MFKVGFTGIPGCGKTTVVRRLASELSKDFTVETIDEFAREYISKFGDINSVPEQLLILDKQMAREKKFKNIDILLTDSPVCLGFFYANAYSKDDKKDLYYVGEIFKKTRQWYIDNNYDMIFHLEPNRKPRKDGVRPELHFDDVWRKDANIAIKALPLLFKVKNFCVVDNKTIKDTVVYCKETIRSLHGKTI